MMPLIVLKCCLTKSRINKDKKCVDNYFSTAWQDKLEFKLTGTTTSEIYENLLRQMVTELSHTDETVSALTNIKIKALESEIAALEAQMLIPENAANTALYTSHSQLKTELSHTEHVWEEAIDALEKEAKNH